MAKRIYIGGDGSSSAEGWQTFSNTGGQDFVSGIVSSFLGFGASIVQSNNMKDIAINTNDSKVAIADSNNSARARIAEAWAAHSKELVMGVLISALSIALIVYLLKGRH